MQWVFLEGKKSEDEHREESFRDNRMHQHLDLREHGMQLSSQRRRLPEEAVSVPLTTNTDPQSNKPKMGMTIQQHGTTQNLPDSVDRWDVTDDWQIGCPEPVKCATFKLRAAKSAFGLMQMYVSFSFNLIKGIMRFVNIEED